MHLTKSLNRAETTGNDQNGSLWNRQIKSQAPFFLVGIAFVLYASRMFRLISRYAVNIFFSDQWDFDSGTLFQKHSLWQIFTWQHGPHRQGLGGLFEKMVDPLFQWNSRTESFVVGGVIVAAAVCAMWLKKRLYRDFSLFDIVIPAIVFIPGQWATWFGVVNFAHGPFPLLLILLYCLAWSSHTPIVKYALILFINFVMIFTGFGVFIGVLTPILLALDYFASTPEARLSKAYFVTALLASVASFGAFFIGYKNRPAAACFSFEPLSVVSYLKFVALMFANFFGLRHLTPPTVMIGGSILAAVLVPLATFARFIWHHRMSKLAPDERNRALITLCLVAYTLLFCVNTAYGRLCLGLNAASQSRYVIYLVPGLLGFYFFLLGVRFTVRRNLILSGFLIAGVAASLHRDRVAMEVTRNIKQAWKACYLQSEDVKKCDNLVGFSIYSPSPQQIQRSHLQEKLEYLKKNRLNLYLDAK